MLRYNWQKIFIASNKNSREIFRIFKMLLFQEIPKNRFDPIYKYSKINFSGESFLAHPDVLYFWSYKHSYRDIAIYISLASVRPFAEYKLNGTVTLSLSNSPVNPHQYLDDPSILPIKEGLIHFPYEEIPKKELQH